MSASQNGGLFERESLVEERHLLVTAVEEHTGMFTALVFGVKEVRPIELPSYGTGEKTAIDSDPESIARPSSSASPSTPGADELDDSLSEGSDENSPNPICPELEAAVEAVERQSTEPLNPLKKIILTAVLGALKIMDESGSCVKTFDDILRYGKTMLYTLIDGNVDLDVLSTMWPKNWNDVQLILKEEGFEDAKEYIFFLSYRKGNYKKW